MGTGKLRYFYLMSLCLVVFVAMIAWKRRGLLETFAVQQQPILSRTNLVYNATTGGAGKALRISIGSDNTVMCINDSDTIMKSSNGRWTMIPGTLNELHVKDVNNIVGVARDFAIYQTSNANAANVSWTKLTASRFDNVSFGWDGSIWATTLPVGGTWGVYTYNTSTNVWTKLPGSIKQVAVLNASTAWGIDPQGMVWKWTSQQWSQQQGQFSKISVGTDGAVWAMDSNGIISRLSTVTNTWQPVSGTFTDLSAKDANTIAVIDNTGNVGIGSLASAGPVAMQQATPFVLSAYSGGSTVYSDYQQSAVAWAQLSVNGKALLDASNSGNGYNVVALNSRGEVAFTKSYDVNQSAAMGTQLAQDLTAMLTSKATNAATNLYGGYTGGQSNSKNFSLTLTDHLIYRGQTTDGYYPANVVPAAYTLTFKYKGTGTFSISQTGIDSGNLSDTLTGTPDWQVYTKQVVHTQSGLHKLTFRNLEVTQTEIEHPVLTATKSSSTKRDVMMLIVLGQGNLGASNPDLVTFFTTLGSTSIANVANTTSYLFVYNARNGNVINEQSSSSSHVLFQSDGPVPVLKSTWSANSGSASTSSVIYIINQGVLIQYDMNAAAVKGTVNLGSTSLPAPFNSGIDSVYPMSDSKTYLMTRGKLWLTTTDLTGLRVKDGPGVIGQGLLSGINQAPFTNGIQAITPSPDNQAYAFSFNTFAKLNASLTQILTTGTLGGKGTEFAGLPTAFQNKIDSAFLAGSTIGLIAGDKLLYYDPKKAVVITGPTSIISNPQFLGLPVSFKESTTNTAKPFFNQTVFPGNLMKNFDISVQVGQEYPGWDTSSFQKFNQNIAYNIVDPPIKVAEFLTMYPSVATTYGTDTNTVLKAYESNDGRWSGVPTYGGNTVSFTIADPSQASYWLSYSNSSGTGFNYTNLKPCEFYQLSLWVRTNDPTGLTVGAESGTPTDTGVALTGIQVKAGDGWQLLTWNFYNPSSANGQDISFTLTQSTNSTNIIHNLYGPVLLNTGHLLAFNIMTKVDEADHVYLNSGGKYLTYDGTNLTFASTATADSKFSLFSINESVIITSATRYASGQPLNLVSDGKTCSVSNAQDASSLWVCIEDENDNTYFVHRATDTMLQIGTDGNPTVAACQNTIDAFTTAAFSFSLDPPVPAKTDAVYVDAAFSQQSNVVLIRNKVFTSYDPRGQLPVIYPISLDEHSWFMNLPDNSKKISSALQQGTTTYLFNGRTFCAWNLTSNSKTTCGLLLGPGGDSQFSKMPPPFSKHIDGAFNLDSSSAVFVSNGMWLQWNVTSNAPIAVGTIGSGMFSGFDASLLSAGIDSCVDNPNQMGSAYFFSSGEYILYDCLKQVTIDGPNTLGSPGTAFAGLTAPFIPSQADMCDLYLQIVKANTDYPKTTCVDDPKRSYQWMSDCIFSDVSCDAAGGVWNDIGGFCGSAISKGATPLRNVDPAKRKTNLANYMQSCKPVSQYDYNTMTTTEQKKYDALNQRVIKDKAEALKLAAKVSSEQKNLQTLNAALKSLQMELTNDDNKACRPNFVCLKSIGSNSVKEIPLGCDQQTIKKILAKNPMTDADLQALLQLLTRKGAINDYPIMQHPDYPNLVRTGVVTKCTPPKDKVITDFAIKDFPDFPKYIRKDQILSGQSSPNTATSGLGIGTNSSVAVGTGYASAVGTKPAGSDKQTSANTAPSNNSGTTVGRNMKCHHGKFSTIIRQALSGK